MFITSKRRYSSTGNIQFIGPSYFGDGSDGALITSGAFLLTPNASNDMIVRNFTNINIGFENTVGASSACGGLLFYATGDCIISGSLSMTAAASTGTGSNDITIFRPTDTGSAQPSSSNFLGLGLAAINSEANQEFISNVGLNRTIKKFGGAGGTGSNATAINGNSGSFVDNGAGGGGGGGFYINTFPSTSGASGSYGGGGTGGRGSAQGSSFFTVGGGGGGNIILIVKGNVIVTSSGSITANGGNGQDGNNISPSQAGAGGGGGGTITILHGGNYINNGIVSVNGGNGGADGGVNVSGGGDGATGSLFIAKIKI